MAEQEPAVEPEASDVVESTDAPVSQETETAEAESQEEGHEAESSPAADSDSDKEPAPLMTRKAQDRWDQLTRRGHEAERDRDAWRDQFTRLQSQAQAAKPEPEVKAPEVPKTLADFGYDETLYRNHLVLIAEDRARVAARTEYDKYQQEQSANAVRTKYNERADKFAKTKDDYREVATRSPISDQVANLVMHLEDGPEVAYFLGLNHDIARSISSIPIEQAAMELGRIDQRLSVERKRTKPVSKAPPPPAKIEGSEASIKKRIDDPKLTDKEFAKMRKAQIDARSSSHTFG